MRSLRRSARLADFHAAITECDNTDRKEKKKKIRKSIITAKSHVSLHRYFASYEEYEKNKELRFACT